MNKSSPVRLAVAGSIFVLSACGSAPPRSESADAAALARLPDAQPSAKAETASPVPVPRVGAAAARGDTVTVPSAATVAPATSATPPAPTPSATAAASAERKAVTLVDRYTVVNGDTLAGIAAKPEVYGDRRLWPLLQRRNFGLVGPQGLIFPDQVLVVDRAYTQADVSALIGQSQTRPPAVPADAFGPKAVTAPSTATVTEGQTKPAVAPVTAPRAGQVAGEASPSLADFLDGARNALGAGDYAWAVYYYSVYLERRNNDSVVWGELGNTHYRDGNLTDAARAFYNSANLLIDKGQTARALDLLPAIQEGDPGLADALLLRLTTVRK